MTDKSNGAVIIGSDFQALGLVRSLAEKGVPIYLIEHELGISRFSRFVKRRKADYSLLSNHSFAERLISIGKAENLEGWVLFPNNDDLVKLLSVNKEKLDKYFRNPVPQWEIVKKFYIKNNAYDIANSLKIPIPKMYKSSNMDELLSQDIQFPIVLKPAFKEKYYPATHKKAIKVNNRKELVEEFSKMAEIIKTSEIVVQEMIEGGPKNLYSYATFFDGKKSVAGLSARRLRQHPMDFGHATTYAVSLKIPELETISVKLLKKIGYYGLAEVEFMRDEKNGEFKFIEINGRVWGWHTLIKGSGINLPYMLFQNIMGKRVDISEPLENVKWIRFITDAPTVTKEILFGRLKVKEYLSSLKGKKEYAVLSIKDPIPFFMEFFMLFHMWRKRGF